MFCILERDSNCILVTVERAVNIFKGTVSTRYFKRWTDICQQPIFFDWLIRLHSKWDWKKMRLKYKLDRVFGNVQLRQVVLAKYGWMTPFRLDSCLINQNRLKHTDGVNKLRWMLLSKSHSFQGRHFIEPHFFIFRWRIPTFHV